MAETAINSGEIIQKCTSNSSSLAKVQSIKMFDKNLPKPGQLTQSFENFIDVRC